MKKTLVSLAAVAALTTGAMAADKGIDIVTTGQAVVYYETHTDGANKDNDIFSKENSAANVGVQLNLGADLGNNFTFGSQLSYLGTLGLEHNLVDGVKQDVTQSLNNDLTSQIMLTKIFVAKKMGNTTLKLGRQELPKSLSPLAFSEGWNVFKNTFDAILAVNTDIPKTTLVGAYVTASNSTVGGNGYANMAQITDGGAYMITAQTKAIPMTTLTGSYYHLSQLTGSGKDTAADAYWVDAKIAGKDMPLGLYAGVQVGSLMPTLHMVPSEKDTTAFGVKVGMKPIKPLLLQVAYSSVDDGTLAVKNTGTGVKTPLFTQMIYNQNAIALDNSTFVVKGVYNMGDMGKVIAQYGMTTSEKGSLLGENDYNELDVIYRIKSGGVSYWASVMMIDTDKKGGIIGSPEDSDTKLRLWARLAF